MSLPFYLSGPLSGLLLGAAFGFILERGGLGNGCKLTGQMRLQDWTVFRVMFTAIIVAAAGLLVLQYAGVMPADSVYVPTTYLWAALVGGAFVGLGMALGGYCPGTSVVALCAGRIDGLFFLGGLLAGTWLFAGAYERLAVWLDAGTEPQWPTLQAMLGVPAWVVVLALVAVAVGLEWILSRQKNVAA
ncbi:MAG: hypothetical protein RL026_60 [Pseudomonadota bacterium]|jgi:uncharacterized membrane protein YedE/YeeE